MAITGTFLANFSSFSDAVAKAEVQLKGFEQSGAKVATSLNRMSNALNGTKLIQDATLMANAVDRIGGTSKLTERELQRVSAQAQEAAAKMRAMGIGVPENLQKIADAARPVTSSLTSLVGTATKLAGVFGVAFSVGGLVNLGRSLLNTANDLTNLSTATGVSTTGLQQFAYVGVQVGVSMDEIGRAVGTLSERLAGGDESAAAAVSKLGLNLNALIAAGPQEAFIQIGEAVGQIQDPMEKNAIAADLFGSKLSKTLIPLLGDLRQSMEDVPKDALISPEQIKAADEFGDAIDRLLIRTKALAFQFLQGFGVGFKEDKGIANVEKTVERLKQAGITSGPIFDQLAQHQANLAAETQAQIVAMNEYIATLGTVKGYAQGSADVEKIHAEMLAYSQEQAQKAADAHKRFTDSVKDATVAMNLGIFTLNKYGAVELPAAERATADFSDVNDVLVSSLLPDLRVKLQQVGITAQKSFGDAAVSANVFKDSLEGLWQGLSGGRGLAGIFENLGKGIVQEFGAIITGGISSLIDKGFSLLEAGVKRLFGGPSAAELAGRRIEASFEQQFTSFADMVNRIGAAYTATGKTFEQARADVERLLAAERQGPAAVQAVIDKINESLDAAQRQADLLREASALYGPSETDKQAAVQKASDIFDAMLKAGTYTQEQLDQAYTAWQKAMAAAGNVAAQEWVKAHEAATAGATAANKAIDDLTKKRDGLAQSIANEAPEAVMGVIETQIRAQMEQLDREIEAANKAQTDAAGDAAADSADAFVDEAERWATYTEDRSKVVAGSIQDTFDSVRIKIPIDFIVPDLPSFGSIPAIPQGSGGDWWVTKPTLFLAGEKGAERATFTPAGTGGGGTPTRQPAVFQFHFGGRKLGDIAIDDINEGGTLYGKAGDFVVRVLRERGVT